MERYFNLLLSLTTRDCLGKIARKVGLVGIMMLVTFTVVYIETHGHAYTALKIGPIKAAAAAVYERIVG